MLKRTENVKKYSPRPTAQGDKRFGMWRLRIFHTSRRCMKRAESREYAVPKFMAGEQTVLSDEKLTESGMKVAVAMALVY
jgi:hypothetical protein